MQDRKNREVEDTIRSFVTVLAWFGAKSGPLVTAMSSMQLELLASMVSHIGRMHDVDVSRQEAMGIVYTALRQMSAELADEVWIQFLPVSMADRRTLGESAVEVVGWYADALFSQVRGGPAKVELAVPGWPI